MDHTLKTTPKHSIERRPVRANISTPQAPTPNEQTRRAQEIRLRLRTLTRRICQLARAQVRRDEEMKQRLRAITKELCQLDTKIYLGERNGRYNVYEWQGIVRSLAELNDSVKLNTELHLGTPGGRYDTHEWRGVKLCLAELSNTVERIGSAQLTKKAA